MSYQDWKQIVWKKSTKKTVLPQKAAGNKQYKTLDEASDAAKISKIPRETAQKLQQGRLAKKLKQTDLANRINMPVKTIQDIENGKYPVNNALFQRIARVLGVSLK
jgi:ribosome-binding protein aMBF1 (putative translation factor)